MSKNGRLFWRNTDDIDPTPILDALAREQGDAWEARQFAALWKETARRAIQSNAFLDSAAAMEQQMAMSESLVAAEAIKRAEKAEQLRDEANDALAEYVKARVARDPLTAREHLDAAWEAAHVPADGTIPAGADFLCKGRDGRFDIYEAARSRPAMDQLGARRLLDPPAPSRPEGAEEWDEELGEMPAADDLTPEQRARLADALAERDHAHRMTGAES